MAKFYHQVPCPLPNIVEIGKIDKHYVGLNERKYWWEYIVFLYNETYGETLIAANTADNDSNGDDNNDNDDNKQIN